MHDLLDMIVRSGVSRRVGIRAGIPGGSDGPGGGGIAIVQSASGTTADGSQAAVAQVLTNTIDVPTTITGSGNVNLVVQAMGFNGGVPLVLPCTVTLADTADDVASKVFAALNGDGTVTGFFYPDFDTGPGKSILTFITLANNDLWASFTVTPTTATGINASSSTITTPGNAEGCQADFVGCLVTGIGAGTYSLRGEYDDGDGNRPMYSLVGQPNDLTAYALNSLGGGAFYIRDGNASVINTSSDFPDFPYLASWTGSTVSPISTPCTAGDTVTVGLSYDSRASFTTPPTFVGGAALTLVATETNAGVTAAIYKGIATGGETGVKYVLDDAVRASMQVLEVSNLGAVEDTSTDSGFSTNPSFNEVTPTSAINLIVDITGYANASDDYIAGPVSPFTRLGTGTGGASVFQEVSYAIQATATPQSAAMEIELSDARDFATVACAIGGA